jgi:antitoxin component YwqK of YwqJK toxin-antitoxin module
MPYDFDTLISETFNPKFRALSGWSFRTKDSILERGYGENGTLIREFACSKSTDSLCAHATLNEWSKEGKPTIAQENLGHNRYRHRHYYDNGKMMTESNYSGTKLDGKYQSWWESGKLNQEIDYRAGKETHWKEWDESGKLIKDESFK